MMDNYGTPWGAYGDPAQVAFGTPLGGPFKNFVMSILPGGAVIHAATGGYASSAAKCDRYTLAYKAAKKAGKTAKARRLKRKKDEFCARAQLKEDKRDARIARKTARKAAKMGVDTGLDPMADTGLDDGGFDEVGEEADAILAEDGSVASGTPSWLVPALIGGGLLLVVGVVASRK